MIVSDHATREGSYVALTRAREQTHIHAADGGDQAPDVDHLRLLGERMSRTESEMPSIRTPVAHESAVTVEADTDSIPPQTTPISRDRAVETPDPESVDTPQRRWPRTPGRDLSPAPQRSHEPGRDDTPGWEP